MNVLKKNKLIFSNYIKENGLKVNYLDIGARGDIQSPWDLFEKESLNVIGFEPDPVEAERLKQVYPNRTYYSNAVWGSNSTRIFNSCECGPTSSMYPPNISIKEKYEEKHWKGRSVANEIEVKCTTLDDVIKKQDIPDFIKIDTQGAEYEILLGAEKLLTENAPLVLAETWCEEVYHGAPLSHDVMKLMYDLGYQVFDYNLAAAWKLANKNNIYIESKRRVIGFDFLFIKSPPNIGEIGCEKFIKLLGLCELFGFRDYSLYLLENAGILDQNDTILIRSILLANNNKEKSYIHKINNFILRKLRLKRDIYPKLH